MSQPEPSLPAGARRAGGTGSSRRSSGGSLRAVSGFVVGLLLMGAVVLSLVTRSVTSDLPTSPVPILDYRSPEESVLLDGAGEVVARFRLVDVAEPADGATDLLVEAFFAASDPTFYESRASRATPAVDALRRAVRGSAPSASPLSTELARVMLAAEAPGLRRRIREEILATRLDADVSVVERGSAWLEWIPLCGGRRGLGLAVRDCLGVRWADLDDRHLALLAGAATAELDLRLPPEVLEARRDAVLDQLVALGRVDPEDSARYADATAEVAHPAGDDAFIERALMEARRLARDAEPRAVTASSWLEPRLQDRLARAGLLSWGAVEPHRGAVLAFGGRQDGPGEALGLALEQARRVRGGESPQVRFLRKLEVAGRVEIPLAPPAALATDELADPVETYASLMALPGTSGLKHWTSGSCRLLVHPSLVMVACGRDEPPGLDLPGLAGWVVEPQEFAIPDGARRDAAGAVVHRSGSGVEVEDEGPEPQ